MKLRRVGIHVHFVIQRHWILCFSVDLMQGQNSTEAFATLPEQLRGVEEEMNDNITPWSLDREENVVDSVIQCRSELYPDKGLRVQGWMLTEAAGYRSGLPQLLTKGLFCLHVHVHVITVNCHQHSSTCHTHALNTNTCTFFSMYVYITYMYDDVYVYQ